MESSPIPAARLAAPAVAPRKPGSPAAAAPDAVVASPPHPAQARAARGPAPAATDVQTHFDAMTKTLVASVVDKETGSVVAEVPPEALRILAQRTAEFRGKIFDAKL
ncbi:flagellar protein FlaG [Hyphomonas sp.]|jgi:hypothetical protein|uniref:flagellar protein FlaG n=1 Tax=Hyphomonas sp. TaxID=87 RepID=UPI0037C07898